jgi:hypothetical protein
MALTHMMETETIEQASPTQSGLVVSTEALSGRFINPPPGKLYLLYGAHEIFRLSLVVASKILGRHRPIAVVDGANRFDAYYLARILREQHGDPQPFLNTIYVSRGFTCYQMEAAITQRLPQFLNRMNSKTAMIFGLLDTFHDEQAKFYEVQKSLQRILRKLHEMKREGVSILIASLEMKVQPEERNRLFLSLKSSVDQIYRFEVSEERCQLVLESTRIEDTKLKMSFRGVPFFLGRQGISLTPRLYEIPRRFAPRNDSTKKKENSHGPHRSNLYEPHSRRSILVGKVPTRTAQRGPRNL